MISASNLRLATKNTLQGFVTLTLQPSGIVLNDCSWHKTADGNEWIGLPAKAQLDREGRQRKDPTTGKTLYAPVVEIAGKEARERFQSAALAAVHAIALAAENKVAA